jgi:hypothetical protein
MCLNTWLHLDSVFIYSSEYLLLFPHFISVLISLRMTGTRLIVEWQMTSVNYFDNWQNFFASGLWFRSCPTIRLKIYSFLKFLTLWLNFGRGQNFPTFVKNSASFFAK